MLSVHTVTNSLPFHFVLNCSGSACSFCNTNIKDIIFLSLMDKVLLACVKTPAAENQIYDQKLQFFKVSNQTWNPDPEASAVLTAHFYIQNFGTYSYVCVHKFRLYIVH